MNMHDYTQIPEHMMISMIEYIKEGRGIGGFLTALFANDFMGTVASADEDNLKILPVYASWIHNKAPHDCHGSYQIVSLWLQKFKGEREKR